MASIVVASFYSVYPFYHGGQRRIFFLSRELSRDHAVTVVALARGGPLRYSAFAPNLTVIRVPAEQDYAKMEERRIREEDFPFNATYVQHWTHCRLYQSILRERLRSGSLAILEQPYSLPAVRDALDGRDVPILYNAHNVETVQMAILKRPERVMPLIRSAEQAAVAESVAIAACTGIDRDGFVSDHAAPPGKIAVIENGVDCAAVPRLTADQRREMRCRLGLGERLTALFGGSQYSPNIAAVECILSAATHLPDITFLVVGTVCNFAGFRRTLPGNVLMLGQLNEAEKWLAYVASDLALNLVVSGSGSNVKMFEYAAAGLPILSTEFGARGTGLRPGEHYYETTTADLAERLGALARFGRDTLSAVGLAARTLVEQTSDWRVIGERYRALAADLIAGGR